MSYLVTGLSGFVGQHLLDRLARSGARVHGITRRPFRDPRVAESFVGDLDAVDDIVAVLERVRPERIVHLAASSSVGHSWHDPVGSFTNSAGIFLNLVEAVRRAGTDCRILSVGSSEQYGAVGSDELPIAEDHLQGPESPYAVGRVSQEMLATMYQASFGLDIVMTRSFNHIGPGQDRRFVVPSFVGRLLDAKAGRGPSEVVTGDLSIVRDFLDVRDVVAAYERLLDEGVSGEVYNVCSGVGTSLETLFGICAERVGVEPVQRTDPELVRPNEIRAIEGSFAKLAAATGWSPSIELSNTVGDIVDSMSASI